MLVLMLPRVSSRVSGFPVASPCLWGKLQNLSLLRVAKLVIMSFCVAREGDQQAPSCKSGFWAGPHRAGSTHDGKAEATAQLGDGSWHTLCI